MYELRKAGNRSVSPNVVTFYAIISAWANSKSRLGAERASAHLEHMKKLATSGHKECKPDKITYEAVIRVWSASGHPDTKSMVHRLREEMSRLKR
jgi:hypothetical protein